MKLFRLSLLLVAFTTLTYPLMERPKLLLDAQGKPTQALQSLLNLMEVDHDGTLASIVEETRKAWLRPPNKERWDIAEIAPEKRPEALKLLDQLGCIKEAPPAKKDYDYAVLLGATVHRVRTRLSYLLDLHKAGIRFKKIIMLGGARPLNPEIESETILRNFNYKNSKKTWELKGPLPTTEMEMMRMVYDQMEIPKGLSCTSINTPMMDNGTRRPNRGDTITTWLSSKPKVGSYLFISNNPFIGYENAVARCHIPKEYGIETAGPRSSDDVKLSVHLDNLARWLYQEQEFRKK